MSTIYLSGPITGHDNWKDIFNAKAAELSEDYKVVNPVDVGEGLEAEFAAAGLGSPRYEDYIRRDLHRLLDCDAIFMLPGWTESTGATLEHDIAKTIGLEVME